MKILYLLFFVPFQVFSQATRRDTLDFSYEREACAEMNRRQKIEYNKLKSEADEMNFDLLTRTLINDLDKRQFTRKYINFIYAYSRFVCDELNGFECISEYNLKDPFYNRNSWTADDLIYLGKKFKDKIIIPSKKGSGFGYNASFYADDESKNEMFRKFKKGIIKDTGEEFYYYSKKNVEPLNIAYEPGMDRVFFDFENLPGYQVRVKRYINGKKTIKLYEYDNDQWEIVE